MAIASWLGWFFSYDITRNGIFQHGDVNHLSLACFIAVVQGRQDTYSGIHPCRNIADGWPHTGWLATFRAGYTHRFPPWLARPHRTRGVCCKALFHQNLMLLHLNGR